jgi:hypothetical protein
VIINRKGNGIPASVRQKWLYIEGKKIPSKSSRIILQFEVLNTEGMKR